MTEFMSLKLGPKLLKILKEEARKEKRTRHNLIMVILEEWLESRGVKVNGATK